MVEIWKDIPNFEGFYKASNLGRIKSVSRIVENFKGKRKIKSRILKSKNSNGYQYVILSMHGKYYSKAIHRLIAETFISNKAFFKSMPCENKNEIDLSKLEINHKDENKSNNKVDNLEWCTSKYNANYGTRKKRSIEKKQKNVVQLNLKNMFIRIWDSASQIEKCLGYDAGTIRNCCRHEIKSAYGYKWIYESEFCK